jgi:hypothetical protein
MSRDRLISRRRLLWLARMVVLGGPSTSPLDRILWYDAVRWGNGMALFMVIERFKGGDPLPVYRRFREKGRLAPEELRYISSWVTADMTACYQLMEADDRAPLDAWISRWADLVDFDVHAVITSQEAAARAGAASSA